MICHVCNESKKQWRNEKDTLFYSICTECRQQMTENWYGGGGGEFNMLSAIAARAHLSTKAFTSKQPPHAYIDFSPFAKLAEKFYADVVAECELQHAKTKVRLP